MHDITSIQARDGLRHTLAEKMAAFEAECGPITTLPIRIGDAPIPGFRIHCPDKPKAVQRVKVARQPSKISKKVAAKQLKIAAIRELAAQGLSMADIADRADFTPKLSVRYVMRAIYENGIPRGKQTNLEAA